MADNAAQNTNVVRFKNAYQANTGLEHTSSHIPDEVARLAVVSGGLPWSTEPMGKSTWGLCINCKWWQLEPRARIAEHTLGLCIDEKLQLFRVRVSGDSGCNRFMEGEPARAKGSSSAPPRARPVR